MNFIAALNMALRSAGYPEAQPYTGRGMVDKRCPSFHTTDNPMLVGFNLGIARSKLGQGEGDELLACEELADLQVHIGQMRTDNFGHSTLYYFPYVAWEAPKVEEDE